MLSEQSNDFDSVNFKQSLLEKVHSPKSSSSQSGIRRRNRKTTNRSRKFSNLGSSSKEDLEMRRLLSIEKQKLKE